MSVHNLKIDDTASTPLVDLPASAASQDSSRKDSSFKLLSRQESTHQESTHQESTHQASSREASSHRGLTREEYDFFCRELGRTPNALELDLVSAMWSEHCSYKSSRALLRDLPCAGDRVIGAAGENAGAIRIGKDAQGNEYAVVFKMESHNHPSMIAPREGAATGVGGIMRDIFTMGARPIANLNALRFGSFSDKRTRGLLEGVVDGIAFYGNCTGIPTIGGECDFDEDYNDNILVNAMTVGLARKDGLFSSRACGVGNLVVYLGAHTGRDGIDGARMASQSFVSAASLSSSKPQVQVGDPFAEKCLFEACLESMEKRLLLALQDMGAAGLLSSSSEMAARGSVGMRLDLDKVPLREEDLSAAEIMLSESQERMLAIVKPAKLEELRQIFARHRLACCVIGRLEAGASEDNGESSVDAETLEEGKLELFWNNEKQASISAALLSTRAPLIERARKPRPRARDGTNGSVKAQDFSHPPLLASLRRLLLSPRLACKLWITEQYDSIIGNGTIAGAGGEAALLRVRETRELLALVSDCTPRYCRNDARLGAMQAVAESWRNLTSLGAVPLAITDNLNFGNPEDAYVMDDFAQAISGIAEACRFFELSVVSGNVSFYNETGGRSIPPTSVIGALGIIEAQGEAAKPRFAKSLPSVEQDQLFLLGATRDDDVEVHSLGASLYMQEIFGKRDGLPPLVDLEREKRHGDFLRAAIATGDCSCARDLSCGGLLAKAALLAMQGGFSIDFSSMDFSNRASAVSFWFGEQQARYLLCLDSEQAATMRARAKKHSIPFMAIGRLSKRAEGLLTLGEGASMSLLDMAREWRAVIPNYMRGS